MLNLLSKQQKMKAFSLFNRGRHSMRFLFFALMMLPAFFLAAQPEVIPLYPGVSPGSESWDWEEGETSSTPIKFTIAYNVSKPSLFLYRPEKPNGISIILVPGGGFYVVNMEHEGHNLAMQLVKKGFTVFVLKYRTGRTTSEDPWNEMLANMRDTALNRLKLEKVRQLIYDDAFAAIRLVRKRAAEYKIDPAKVGVVGFSGGGGLTLRLCTSQEVDARPDFAGLIYAVYRPAEGDTLPSTIPPVFIACANDDILAPPINSLNLYSAWLRAKRPAELHLFNNGGHGLRVGNAAKNWIRRFEEWLDELVLQ
jgi:acetyl esterase/lipase